MTAILEYTLNATYAISEEGIKGQSETGKLANFVVLFSNLLEIDPTQQFKS